MIEDIKHHLNEVASFTSTNVDEIESFRIKYLSKKGLLTDFFAAFKTIPNNQKKEYGQLLNALKTAIIKN